MLFFKRTPIHSSFMVSSTNSKSGNFRKAPFNSSASSTNIPERINSPPYKKNITQRREGAKMTQRKIKKENFLPN